MASGKTVRVETANWKIKVHNVKTAETAAVVMGVDWGLDRLNEATVRNVTGDHYGFKTTKSGNKLPIRGPRTNAGILPVPVVYGQLRRSIKSVRMTPTLGAVYSDDNIAPYNKFVHDGTRKMQPRPFLQMAVTVNRPLIHKYIEKKLRTLIKKVGLK